MRRYAAQQLAAIRFLSLLILLSCLGGCGFFSHAGQSTEPRVEADEAAAAMRGKPVPYTTAIVPADQSDAAAKTLAADMDAHSQLIKLASEPPDSLLGLERRARADQAEALKLMRSRGYFEGTADVSMPGAEMAEGPAGQEADAGDSPASVPVTLTLWPGVLYKVGDVAVRYTPEPVVPSSFLHRTRETGFLFSHVETLPDPAFPAQLGKVRPGDPAQADPILDDVASLPGLLHRQGYPFAKVASTRFTLHKDTQTLNVDIAVDSGPPAVMEDVEVSGTEKVNPQYLRRLIPWKKGEPWNADRVAEYRNTLQKLGLFSVVDVGPGALPATADAQPTPAVALPVSVKVVEAPARTLSAGATYATDVGAGVQGSWENRNLFGYGEKLRFRAIAAQNEQSFKIDFEKPAFLLVEQKFLAGTFISRETTDAYDKTGMGVFAGMERRLTRNWWAEARFSVEAGNQEDSHERHHYQFFSFKLGARRDTRDSLMEPTRGSLLSFYAQPYMGAYDGPFNTTAFRAEGSAYQKVRNNLVLAGRLAMGGMVGGASRQIPASLRFYQGGGGSVRGYPYQAIGPRDVDNKPEGGRSFQQVNLEARVKITESIGVVPFVDGGMVYDSVYPQWSSMAWAVGLGLRYYTPIGPVRLDVALPLTHYRNDSNYQLYISIGQAF